MNWAQIAINAVLALAAIITAIFGVLFYRETKRQKAAEADKTSAEVDKTEAEKTEIANKAAQINEQRERERERWWQEQFGLLRDEFEGERQLSIERWRQLNALERYVGALLRYVRGLIRRLQVHGEEVPEPPPPPDIDGHVRQPPDDVGGPAGPPTPV